jgi:hypothetical protein
MKSILDLSQTEINEITAALVVTILVVVFILVKIRKRFTKSFNNQQITNRWQTLQKNCSTRKTWPIAIIEADTLLDDVLKGMHYKGKTTGERLVAAQHDMTTNDLVWYGHKLSTTIKGQDVRKLKKQDIVNALSGFRQALKDLGALE